MKPAIEIHNLGKRYQLGLIGTGTLKHDVQELFNRLRGKKRTHNPKTSKKILWALRQVNFSVNPGEMVGIVGKNGSGKSTLLKILSRITEPTEGHALIRGHLSALLEVGTGFHPELTGRENIYLNGAILGMDRQTITKRLDEIIAFAETSAFLDTPVKHYSSGMYVRLGFAVAAHLNTDILILDEVLAVGDTEFRKKCHARIRELTAKGCTILIVSHDTATLSSFCPRSILLHQGNFIAAGHTNDILKRLSQVETTPLPLAA